MRGVTTPHAHQNVSDESRVRLQLGAARPGRANNRPRMLHSRSAANHRAHTWFKTRLANAARCVVLIAKALTHLADFACRPENYWWTLLGQDKILRIVEVHLNSPTVEVVDDRHRQFIITRLER